MKTLFKDGTRVKVVRVPPDEPDYQSLVGKCGTIDGDGWVDSTGDWQSVRIDGEAMSCDFKVDELVLLVAESELTQLDVFTTEAVRLAALAWPGEKASNEMADSLVARLCEETGEVARAVRRYGRQRWGHIHEGAGTSAEVTEELGDIIFLAARIADLCGVNLNDALDMSLVKFHERLRDMGIEP